MRRGRAKTGRPTFSREREAGKASLAGVAGREDRHAQSVPGPQVPTPLPTGSSRHRHASAQSREGLRLGRVRTRGRSGHRGIARAPEVDGNLATRIGRRRRSDASRFAPSTLRQSRTPRRPPIPAGTGGRSFPRRSPALPFSTRRSDAPAAEVGPAGGRSSGVRQRRTRHQKSLPAQGEGWSSRRDDRSPPFRFRQTQLRNLRQDFRTAEAAQQARQVSQRRQALPVHLLRQGLQRHLRPQASHQNAHGSASLQVRHVRQVLHPTMLAGIPQAEGARHRAPVRLQGEEDQDVRVRRVRPHQRRARGPLPAPEASPPLQPGTAQVLRQATLQVPRRSLSDGILAARQLNPTPGGRRERFRFRFSARARLPVNTGTRVPPALPRNFCTKAINRVSPTPLWLISAVFREGALGPPSADSLGPRTEKA